MPRASSRSSSIACCASSRAWAISSAALSGSLPSRDSAMLRMSGERDQALLRAVVEVALDAPALLVGRRDDPLAGVAQVVDPLAQRAGPALLGRLAGEADRVHRPQPSGAAGGPRLPHRLHSTGRRARHGEPARTRTLQPSVSIQKPIAGTVPYVSTWTQFEAEKAFRRAARARRRAELMRRVRRACVDCGRLAVACGQPQRSAAALRGAQEIPVDAITATVEPNRAAQFDGDFRPRQAHAGALAAGLDGHARRHAAPAHLVVDTGDGYAIRDGHHRVSVAKALGICTINAVVA